MKPAFSIVFFTVVSGAALGVLALVGFVALFDLPWLSAAMRPAAGGLGVALALAGLASSALHLANPRNAWRAYSRFRTSWLSREAVFSIALLGAAVVLVALLWREVEGPLRSVFALLTIVLAWIVVVCTAMIYGSLKPIRQWHTRWTPVVYFVLGHWSGALIAIAVAVGYGGEPVSWAWLAAGLGVAALLVKLGYWHHGAADRGGKSALTLEQAIGVPQGVRPPGVSVAQARLFDAGHTQRTFLTDEFVFRIARQHAQALRGAALALGFGIPLIWLATGPRHWAAAASVAVLAIVGLLAERWLFFSDARHTVRLYHGDART